MTPSEATQNIVRDGAAGVCAMANGASRRGDGLSTVRPLGMCVAASIVSSDPWKSSSGLDFYVNLYPCKLVSTRRHNTPSKHPKRKHGTNPLHIMSPSLSTTTTTHVHCLPLPSHTSMPPHKQGTKPLSSPAFGVDRRHVTQIRRFSSLPPPPPSHNVHCLPFPHHHTHIQAPTPTRRALPLLPNRASM